MSFADTPKASGQIEVCRFLTTKTTGIGRAQPEWSWMHGFAKSGDRSEDGLRCSTKAQTQAGTEALGNCQVSVID